MGLLDGEVRLMMMRFQQLERNNYYRFGSFCLVFLVFVCMLTQFVYLLDMLLGWFVYLLVFAPGLQ